MPDPLIRGAVVARGRRVSVVWLEAGGRVELLSVIVPRQPWRHDVALQLSDLVGSGIETVGTVVRPRRNPPEGTRGLRRVGVLPGPVMCRVVHALVRGEAEEIVHAKWDGDRRHRKAAADERPVRM